jgi:hypothetical protein
VTSASKSLGLDGLIARSKAGIVDVKPRFGRDIGRGSNLKFG